MKKVITICIALMLFGTIMKAQWNQHLTGQTALVDEIPVINFTGNSADSKDSNKFSTLNKDSVMNNTPTPVLQTYTTFQGVTLNLYKWEGTNTMVLSGSNTLNPAVMGKWVDAMDGAYNYYYSCTNQYPACYKDVTCFNGKSTLARVDATCGAACGYLGTTGIEMLNTYFDTFYNSLANDNLYEQEPFYEFGRNYWFYNSKLQYLSNDPIVTGYAVFMRFMAMDYLKLPGANFGNWTFQQFQDNVKGLLGSYMADPTLDWNNTLAVNQGIAGSGLGATDLFASFCFYLKENYGGHTWVQNVWKYSALRPDAVTTQDAVDNFIIAASQAANANLIPLFQYWKWSPSPSAILFLNSLAGLSYNVTVPAGTNACYITGTMNNRTLQAMNRSDPTHYTLNILTATIADTYKYYSGPALTYVEKDATGNDIPDRSYSTADVVANWASIYTDVKHINSDNIKLIGGKSFIRAEFDGNATISVYSISGWRLKQTNAQGSITLENLNAGLYIVKINGRTYKVMVQ